MTYKLSDVTSGSLCIDREQTFLASIERDDVYTNAGFRCENRPADSLYVSLTDRERIFFCYPSKIC